MIIPDQITAALKALGPSGPTAIANHMKVEPSALGYSLRKMLGAKTLKAAGATTNRVYALPDQKPDAANAPPGPPREQEAGRQEARRPQGQEDQDATRRAPRRSFHPGRRRRHAPGDRQRRAAPAFHRRADRGDRHAARQSL